jgi:hypothetical protein
VHIIIKFVDANTARCQVTLFVEGSCHFTESSCSTI